MTFFQNLVKEKQPQELSRNIGIVTTIVLWVIFCICLCFIKPVDKKEKFKTVQIVLSPEKNTVKENKEKSLQRDLPQSDEENPVPAETPEVVNDAIESAALSSVPVVESNPALSSKAEPEIKSKKVVEKAEIEPVEKKVEKIEQKKNTSSSSEKQAIPSSEPIEYSKTIEELMAEQMQQPKKVQKEFDWSMFEDDTHDTLASDADASNDVMASDASVSFDINSAVTSGNSISGSAGTVVEKKDSVKTVSSNKSELNEKQSVSDSTSQRLKNISETKFLGGNSSSSIKTASTIKNTGKNSDGKINWTMSEGFSRALLEPSEPDILISEKNAALIDTTRTVNIVFKVTANGNVPLADIKITPESVVPYEIRKEIAEQISKWRFDSADTEATAKFEFSIIKN